MFIPNNGCIESRTSTTLCALICLRSMTDKLRTLLSIDMFVGRTTALRFASVDEVREYDACPERLKWWVSSGATELDRLCVCVCEFACI